MPLSLAQLKQAIEEHLAAHPGNRQEIVDAARNSKPPSPGSELVETDPLRWYRKLVAVGQGRLVTPRDDPANRRIGFSVDIDGSQTTFSISLLDYGQRGSEIPLEARNLLTLPSGRAELARRLSEGSAP